MHRTLLWWPLSKPASEGEFLDRRRLNFWIGGPEKGSELLMAKNDPGPFLKIGDSGLMTRLTRSRG